MIRVLTAIVLLAPPPPQTWTTDKIPGAIVVKAGGAEVLRYQLEKPADSKLAVEGACYFHPLTTPSGISVTDVAPSDHPHHRGIFLAWVEMHGAKDADFWGWGEHAPKDKRKIVNREATDLKGGEAGSFRARNDWLAEDVAVVTEDLQATVRKVDSAHVLDLVYTITAAEEMKISQWAFSGFCLRTRKDVKLETVGPDGPVKLKDPKHTDPKSDWPAAAWYGFNMTLPDGKVAGAAVIDHPKNPPTLWHVVKGIGMLNPSVTAPAALTLRAKEPLVLRYRVVATDGPLSLDAMSALVKEWGK